MSTESAKKPFYKDPTHMLYLSVIAAVILGCILGITVPDFAKELQPIGTGFIALIKMMIAPVIFCTIVLGVGSIAKAATVGKGRWIGAAVLRTHVNLCLRNWPGCR